MIRDQSLRIKELPEAGKEACRGHDLGRGETYHWRATSVSSSATNSFASSLPSSFYSLPSFYWQARPGLKDHPNSQVLHST